MKLLLPVDGSTAALAAVRFALGMAGPGGASFVLANVQEPASLYEVVVTHDVQRIEALRRDAGADLLREAEALLDGAGAQYESEVAGGAPEHVILELAERYGCDAIVMGANGQGAAPGASALGSVALAVLRASAQPVTVVRSPPIAEPEEGTDAPASA
jgi:nucleotide-binding universal stress UspA family protein